MTAAAIPAPARIAVLSDPLAGTRTRSLALVVAGAAFVGLMAQLSVPVPGSPVPITGQTFAVLLGGAALGWRRSLASMSLYLVAGMAGLPWFAGHHSGGVHLPSLGYILAYVVVAPGVGALAARGGDRTPLRTVLTMTAGTVVIYLIGATYLAADLHLSAATAVAEGVRPFLVGDSIKVLLAAAVLPGAWGLVARTAR